VKLVRLTALVAATAALGIAGCGDDADDSRPTPAADAFARFMDADAPVVSYVDFAQAREQLGLPEDADALEFEAVKGEDFNNPSPEGQLISAAVIGMPSLTTFVETLDEDPASQEFDGAAIDAAANTITDDGPLTIVHTTQPFSEIADGLTALGYRAEGTVLTKEGERFEQVADGGDGFIVIGRNQGAADAVAAQTGGPSDLLGLLEPADQPIQQVAKGIPDDCVTALGGWENAQTTEGVLTFQVEGGADADAFDTGELEHQIGLDAGEPSVDGDTAQVPFTTDISPPGSRVRIMLTRFVSGYDCG
jgi:hypothetical protein